MKDKVILLSIFVIFLAILWIIVYNIRLFQIEKAIKNMNYASEFTEEQNNIKIVKVLIDDETYTVNEFTERDNIPTVVDVMVLYDNGEVETKSAYVSYDDIDDAIYEDGAHGRLILPQGLRKE